MKIYSISNEMIFENQNLILLYKTRFISEFHLFLTNVTQPEKTGQKYTNVGSFNTYDLICLNNCKQLHLYLQLHKIRIHKSISNIFPQKDQYFVSIINKKSCFDRSINLFFHIMTEIFFKKKLTRSMQLKLTNRFKIIINSGYISLYFYKVILKQHINVYSEKIWLGHSMHYNWIIETFSNNYNISKYTDLQSTSQFSYFEKFRNTQIKFNLILLSMIEIYINNISQHFFYTQMHFLKIHFRYFFKKTYLSYSLQFYSFFQCYYAIDTNILVIKNVISNIDQKSIENRSQIFSFFKRKQNFKKLLLQFLLVIRRETLLNLTNYSSTISRNIYDSIEYLYEVLKDQPKYVFRIDLTNSYSQLHNNFNFFHSKLLNWVSNDRSSVFCSKSLYYLFFSKTQFIENSYSSVFSTIDSYSSYSQDIFLDQISNNVNIKTIPKHKQIGSCQASQLALIYLLNNRLSRQYEKHLIYTYYRFNTKNLTLLDKNYRSRNCFIQYKNATLILSNDSRTIVNYFILLKKWFLTIGFQFSQTPIFHSCFSVFDQKAGFEFYGFYFFQKIKQINRFLNLNFLYEYLYFSQFKFRQNLLYQTQILPSKFCVIKYLDQLKKIIKKSTIYSQEFFIKKLKQKIEAWSFYYKISTNKKIFNFCDYILFKWLWKWSCRRHPTKSRQWIKKKYYYSLNRRKWAFCFYNSSRKFLLCLPEHRQINLIRHIKIRNYLCFYNEIWKYWLKRALSNIR